jgi:microcompartment protein CcmL/EutN
MGETKYNALGLVETFGLIFVLEAADAMVKAAEVELVGYENTASGYISVLVGGDVAACKTAVDAGVKAVQDMNGNLYSHVVIARPHPELFKITERYTLDKLLPCGVDEGPSPEPVQAQVDPKNDKRAAANKAVRSDVVVPSEKTKKQENK